MLSLQIVVSVHNCINFCVLSKKQLGHYFYCAILSLQQIFISLELHCSRRADVTDAENYHVRNSHEALALNSRSYHLHFSPSRAKFSSAVIASALIHNSPGSAQRFPDGSLGEAKLSLSLSLSGISSYNICIPLNLHVVLLFRHICILRVGSVGRRALMRFPQLNIDVSASSKLKILGNMREFRFVARR